MHPLPSCLLIACLLLAQAHLEAAQPLTRRLEIFSGPHGHSPFVSSRSELRGLYPSDVVMGRILDSGRHFIVRMVAADGAAWQEVRDFLASGKRDAVVPVEVGEGPTRRIVHLRMVLRTFDRGRPHKHQSRTTMVLVTSVLNKTLTVRDLCRLY